LRAWINVQRLNLLCLLAVLGGFLPSIDAPLPIQLTLSGQQLPSQTGQTSESIARWTPTKEERLAFIRRAQVWRHTDIPNMDLRAGPNDGGIFQPNELVTCDYTPRPLHGSSRKFYCALPDGEVVKVRYGAHNREVEGSVLATRLLWALGFVADRVYPVRVRCRGCSPDPWTDRATRNKTYEFDPAVIERGPEGQEVWDGSSKAGWEWSELDEVDATVGGAPQEQRDALKLLAVFMQHTDTKPQQQRLLCASQGVPAVGMCDQPFLFLHDVGLTFGHANAFNRNSTASVNLAEWASTPLWKDRAGCIGHLSRAIGATLGDPHISEAGRRFLADLLVQLADRQLQDLFEVAQVDRRPSRTHGLVAATRVDDWIAVFKQKRNDIVMNHCAQ
jgi:hypothetical protein